MRRWLISFPVKARLTRRAHPPIFFCLIFRISGCLSGGRFDPSRSATDIAPLSDLLIRPHRRNLICSGVSSKVIFVFIGNRLVLFLVHSSLGSARRCRTSLTGHDARQRGGGVYGFDDLAIKRMERVGSAETCSLVHSDGPPNLPTLCPPTSREPIRRRDRQRDPAMTDHRSPACSRAWRGAHRHGLSLPDGGSRSIPNQRSVGNKAPAGDRHATECLAELITGQKQPLPVIHAS